MCQRRQNAAMSRALYGLSKFSGKRMFNIRASPIAMSE